MNHAPKNKPQKDGLFSAPWNGVVFGSFAGWLTGLGGGWGLVSSIVCAILAALMFGGLEALTARYDQR